MWSLTSFLACLRATCRTLFAHSKLEPDTSIYLPPGSRGALTEECEEEGEEVVSGEGGLEGNARSSKGCGADGGERSVSSARQEKQREVQELQVLIQMEREAAAEALKKVAAQELRLWKAQV